MRWLKPVFPLIAATFFSAATPAAEPLACPGLSVSVVAAEEAEKRLACTAAAQAIDFFTGCGLRESGPVEIRILDALSKPPSPHVMAQFDPASGAIEILHYDRYPQELENRTLLRIGFDKSLYQSLIVHEMAHALVEQQSSPEPAGLAITEYAAAVAQLQSLPPEHLSNLLAEFRNEGFSHRREITDLLWAMDPEVFAVKAYRHFIAPGNGCSFLRQEIGGTGR